MKQEKTTEKEQTSAAKSVFEIMEIFVFAAVSVLLVLTFCCRLCVVDGPSMNNTLYDGERLLISDLFYTPEQGDIVVFHQTGDGYNKPIVKRVIATEGQYVKIDYKNMQVFVSEDDVFDENDLINESGYAYFSNDYWFPTVGKGHAIGAALCETGVRVPEGKLFVLGDNRNNSADSRTDAIGFVDTDRVLGKVIWCVPSFNG